MEFAEEIEGIEIKYTLKLTKLSYSSYYFITISRRVLYQINYELMFEFNNEKTLFDALQFNYNSRNNFPPLTFSCSFLHISIHILLVFSNLSW